jgi:hypothetical protein
MKREDIQLRFEETGLKLVSEMNPDGFWTGRLSSSALGVAVSIAALHFYDPIENYSEIKKGLDWLCKNINADGSYGDTPESPGNISTSLLVYAAFNLYAGWDESIKKVHGELAAYLLSQGIDVRTPQVAENILAHYKKDYTFSVPILAMCGLCYVPGDDAFNYIPQLPFELSLLPRKFYRLLNLSVVSYAIPALVAVGIVIFKKKKSGFFWRLIRKYSIPKALKILYRMLPESGGFLEAIPLTAFVSLSLINSGYKDSIVVRKGIRFLRTTQRPDGGWPIDVDLSTWVTSSAVRGFRSNLGGFLDSGQQDRIADHLRLIQNKTVHPFNEAIPGGWGWTNFPGSVPDGDDTPGVILAILKLQPKEKVKNEILAACRWLGNLQNSDGGFPTFSKGWGKLPFDQSCPDLTGHSLLALAAVLEVYGGGLPGRKKRQLEKMFDKALFYLGKHQQPGGSWLPLWFGNQNAPGHLNPVYGTARVVTYLKDAAGLSWISGKRRQRLVGLAAKGTRFLMFARNADGSWGGNAGVAGTMEETALAVSALSSPENMGICQIGLAWLDRFYLENGLKPAPIGLYFASLWYDEKLYPATFYLEALARILEVLETVEYRPDC